MGKGKHNPNDDPCNKAIIIGFFVLDYFVFHLDAMTFILRLLIETIAKMAFWR